MSILRELSGTNSVEKNCGAGRDFPAGYLASLCGSIVIILYNKLYLDSYINLLITYYIYVCEMHSYIRWAESDPFTIDLCGGYLESTFV